MLSNSDFQIFFYFPCLFGGGGCADTDNLVPLSITVSSGEAELLGACQEMVTPSCGSALRPSEWVFVCG